MAVQKDGSDGNVYLYGYIGNSGWWVDSEEKTDDITIVKAIHQLEADPTITTIKIRINSSGGSVRHADAIISAIKQCKKTIQTYNDGQALSAAADIWLTADKENRFMEDHAKLMIHNTIGGIFGNAAEMREAADILDKFDKAACTMLAKALEISEEEAMQKYYDYKDHWFLKSECVEMGLINASDGASKNDSSSIDKEKLMDEAKVAYELFLSKIKHLDQEIPPAIEKQKQEDQATLGWNTTEWFEKELEFLSLS